MRENKIEVLQKHIKLIKDFFERELSKSLNLLRVSAPMLLFKDDKLNDYLGIKEKPISFKSKYLKKEIEVIQSLAKWKRLAIKRYEIPPYRGLYTDMNAIRPNEILDKTHSFYVDQWDWELHITEKDLNLDFLKDVASKIYDTIIKTYNMVITVDSSYKKEVKLPKELYFISSNDLYKLYPKLTPSEREFEIAKKHRAVFITKIGYNLPNGKPHSIRAYDYDNWDLNGDLIMYHEKIKDALELSSMGIRVSKDELINQAKIKGIKINQNIPYYDLVLNNKNYTIGGGIGQSRLCQYLLNKLHIGEVQASLWDKENEDFAKKNKIILL